MNTNGEILLVEDDANDAFFVTRALEKLGFNGSLRHVLDVDAAKTFLSDYAGGNSFGGTLVVIADSTITCRGTGVDLLEWVRNREEGKTIPFIILSGELCPETTERARCAGVDFILIKHQDSTDTIEQLRKVFLEMPPAFRTWLKK